MKLQSITSTRMRSARVWSFAIPIILIAVDRQLVTAESTLRIVPAAKEKPVSQPQVVEIQSDRSLIKASIQPTAKVSEIRVVSPPDQRNWPARPMMASRDESTISIVAEQRRLHTPEPSATSQKLAASVPPSAQVPKSPQALTIAKSAPIQIESSNARNVTAQPERKDDFTTITQVAQRSARPVCQ